MMNGCSLSILYSAFAIFLGVFTFTNCENLNVSVIVVSQPLTKYYTERYNEFSSHLKSQLPINDVQVEIFRTNHDKQSSADWMISPLLLRERNFFLTQQWVIVCEDDTRMDFKELLNFLFQHSPEKTKLFGRGMYDDEPTIIHHFHFNDGNTREFKYPSRAFGYVLSNGLLHKLIDQWGISSHKMSFRIDIEHEMAMTMKELQISMNEENDLFCMGEKSPGCITWLLNETRLPDCGKKLTTEDIYFAVKTCDKYLDERVPYIQNTWANDTGGNIGYFAEVDDEDTPTIKLNIKNYNGGFCLKMLEIIRWFYNNKKDTSWLVIADDDTLMSVPRLQYYLGCSDPTEAVVIGERYGYRSHSRQGYDYITGGGGMVLSRSAVEKMIEKSVSCGSPDGPDDMILGTWAKELNIPLIHCPLFHQARPMDYAGFLINKRKSISFHKFWNMDPELAYQRWLLPLHRQKEFIKTNLLNGNGQTATQNLIEQKKKKRRKVTLKKMRSQEL